MPHVGHAVKQADQSRRSSVASMEADEPWWLDYWLYLLLIGVGASMAVLRVAGAVDWSWWLVASPVLLLVAVYVGTYLVLRLVHRRHL